jgi:hypothetical protein
MSSAGISLATACASSSFPGVRGRAAAGAAKPNAINEEISSQLDQRFDDLCARTLGSFAG